MSAGAGAGSRIKDSMLVLPNGIRRRGTPYTGLNTSRVVLGPEGGY